MMSVVLVNGTMETNFDTISDDGADNAFATILAFLSMTAPGAWKSTVYMRCLSFPWNPSGKGRAIPAREINSR